MIWKPTIGRYEVSDQGDVRHAVTKHIRARGRGQYAGLTLYVDGVYVFRHVHRLVLETFVGPCPLGMVARHLNGDSRDDRLANLRWGTQAENYADARRHGTSSEGERHGRAKLDADKVVEIRHSAERVVTLAGRYGVTPATVYAARRRKSWAHVG